VAGVLKVLSVLVFRPEATAAWVPFLPKANVFIWLCPPLWCPAGELKLRNRTASLLDRPNGWCETAVAQESYVVSNRISHHYDPSIFDSHKKSKPWGGCTYVSAKWKIAACPEVQELFHERLPWPYWVGLKKTHIQRISSRSRGASLIWRLHDRN